MWSSDRVAPVGVFYESRSVDRLVSGAREASISTHGGSLAIAAAAATAAAVSAAIDGESADRIVELAERAAALAESQWGSSTAPFTNAIRAVHHDLASLPMLRAEDVGIHCFPNRPLTIVPLALAIATLSRSAEEGILLAANVGGDSDSVASIAGGILGAMYPESVNQQWFEIVARVNGHDLETVARELVGLRH